MTLTNPRMAVAYHFFNDHDTAPITRARIRKTYNGPLTLALDYMVFNITKDNIRVRMSNVDREVWPTPSPREKEGPKIMKLLPLLLGPSRSNVLTMPEVIGPIYDEVNKKYGTNYVPLWDMAAFKAANVVVEFMRLIKLAPEIKPADASESAK